MFKLVFISFVLVCASLLVLAQSQPPQLPYNSFSAWAVLSQNTMLPNGTTLQDWSYGQMVDVDHSQQVRCRYNIQELYPVEHPYTWVVITNYSARSNKSKVVTQSGRSTNCTNNAVNGPLPAGGGWYLAPDPTTLSKLVFSGYHSANNINCSVYQATFTTQTGYSIFIQWYVDVAANVPVLYINETKNLGTKFTKITTTAFQGYHQLGKAGLSVDCTNDVDCTGGPGFCVANPTASPAVVGPAIAWACSQISCSAIGQGARSYYPNTLTAHGTYAFNQYYQQNKAGGAQSCDFNGAAELVSCPAAAKCFTCNATSNADPAKLEAAIKWVCGSQGIQDCTAIQPGGDHYWPNSTYLHANWAFDLYYQAYKCVPGMEACDFGGVAHAVPCCDITVLPCDTQQKQLNKKKFLGVQKRGN